VREGWEPLCGFFGVEVPEDPFPRLNDAREMRRRLLGLVALSATVPALAVLTGVATTVFFVRRVARSRRLNRQERLEPSFSSLRRR
jgi:hypothetical protein